MGFICFLKYLFEREQTFSDKYCLICLSLQMRLLGECRGSIDAVKEAEGELTEDTDDVPGLTNPTVMDAQGKGQLVTHTCHL